MIPRLLVPPDARLSVAADAVAPNRRPSPLDQRKLVPATLPIVVLDGRTNIPLALPLDSIAARVVVPRDVQQEAYGVQESVATPLQPTDMDQRVTVPQGAAPPEVIAPPQRLPLDLVDADIFMTGEARLMAEPLSRAEARKELVTRVTSIIVHFLFIALIILQPKIFPPHQPTRAEQEMARKQLTLLLPPGAFDTPRPPTPPQPHVEMRVDPRVLRKVAPPAPAPAPVIPQPKPQPEVRELPSSPVPQPNAEQPVTPAPKPEIQPKPPLKLETPDAPTPSRGLVLPKTSPGRTVQDLIRESAKNQSGESGAISGPMPGLPPSPGGGGGGGQGQLGNGYEILTPTEGVDFSNYMARVLASVRRNWYAVMPESARLGDRGIVVLQFKIMRNGVVPADEPNLMRTSSKEPLDRAAVSAIRTSSPFDQLPSAFSGPYIELRFIFLYNLPISAANQ